MKEFEFIKLTPDSEAYTEASSLIQEVFSGNMLEIKEETLSILENVQLDLTAKKIIWLDKKCLNISDSLEHFRTLYSSTRPDIDEAMCIFLYWLENESEIVEETDDAEDLVSEMVDNFLNGKKNPLIDLSIIIRPGQKYLN